MTTTYPAGVSAMLHTVRDALHAKGVTHVHVEPYARGVLITVRPNDRDGAHKISRAHAALRAADVPPSHIHRQAPNVLRVIVRLPRRKSRRV